MREPPRLVVVNTTPIISLALIDQLSLLQQLYAEVLIPPAVSAEISAGAATAPGVAALDQSPWIRAVALQDPRR